MGSAPVRVLDLASESAWSASVDGAPPRPIVVPGGGYNSDLQPKPWIDGYLLQKSCPESQNMTYRRSFDLPTDELSAGRAVFIEFGGAMMG